MGAPENLILIVDDQEEDQRTLVWTLRKLGVTNPIHSLLDGHEALRYFNGDTPYHDRKAFPLPSILFLDLKLPVLTGWEVLVWLHGVRIKSDSCVFIYSEISNVGDVRRLYSLGADSFVRKPATEAEVMSLIRHFPHHWTFQQPSAQEHASSAS